jgi:hypothetical protein
MTRNRYCDHDSHLFNIIIIIVSTALSKPYQPQYEGKTSLNVQPIATTTTIIDGAKGKLDAA